MATRRHIYATAEMQGSWEWNPLSAMTTRFMRVGDSWLCQQYCSHTRVKSETMKVLDQYLMWTSLCTTKGWRDTLSNGTYSMQSAAGTGRTRPMCTAPADSERFRLVLDYEVVVQFENEGVCENWMSWKLFVWRQLFYPVLVTISFE